MTGGPRIISEHNIGRLSWVWIIQCPGLVWSFSAKT